MARTLILHIGLPKTGSTSLQHRLVQARKSLRTQGFCYPATENDYKHTLMALSFASFEDVFRYRTNHVWRGREPAEVIAAYRHAFAAEMQALPVEVDRVIMSAEQFVQYVRKPPEIRALHTEMSRFFDKFRIVLYLRRQDAHFASMYAQGLRTGRVVPPDMTALNDWLHDYDYADMVTRWADVFGAEAMRVRIFENTPGKQFDVVADFSNGCGFVFPDAKIDATLNASMNLQGQHVLAEVSRAIQNQVAARELRQSGMWRQLSFTVTKALPGKGWQPTRSEAMAFMERFAATNEAVRQTWFPNRESLFSTDFSALPETHVPPDPAGDFQAACVVIAELLQSVVSKDGRSPESSNTIEGGSDVPRKKRGPKSPEARSMLKSVKQQIEDGLFDIAGQNIELALQSNPESKMALRLRDMLERRRRRTGRKPAAGAAAEGQKRI